jgi:hypothetical protein
MGIIKLWIQFDKQSPDESWLQNTILGRITQLGNRHKPGEDGPLAAILFAIPQKNMPDCWDTVPQMRQNVML